MQDLSEYFTEMKELSQKKGVMKNRIRFMLQDVIDLRQCKWVPRGNDETPKTMKEIQKEGMQWTGASSNS
jgi:translation initiation factor 4G